MEGDDDVDGKPPDDAPSTEEGDAPPTSRRPRLRLTPSESELEGVDPKVVQDASEILEAFKGVGVPSAADVIGHGAWGRMIAAIADATKPRRTPGLDVTSIPYVEPPAVRAARDTTQAVNKHITVAEAQLHVLQEVSRLTVHMAEASDRMERIATKTLWIALLAAVSTLTGLFLPVFPVSVNRATVVVTPTPIVTPSPAATATGGS